MEGEVTPQPLPGLPGVAPPPFLSKTFEMVEDPATDSVVSWSQARNSFVIWDCHKLATALLPKYFKHGNFCSFIRQLNTYGFRKVNPDRWEFANERFLGGQKHLLKDIKRRRNTGQATQQPQSATACSEPGKESGACVELGQFGFETEVEWLKRDRSVLAAEIVKLKQQQQKSLVQVAALEQRLQGTERKQKQAMVFLAKALSNPTFVQQLILRYEQKRQVEGACRKRRLTASPSPDNLQTAADSRMEPEIERLFADSRVEPEIETLFSSIDSDADSLSRDQLDEGVTMESGDPIIGARSEGIWEELFSEGLIPGGVGPEKGDEEEIHMEMDELADEWGAGPSEWGEEDEKSLAEQMGYLASKLSGFKALG